MKNYQKEVRATLCQHHPDFWHRMRIADLEKNPMLFGYWQLVLKQSQRQGLCPASAAEHFISATRRRRCH